MKSRSRGAGPLSIIVAMVLALALADGAARDELTPAEAGGKQIYTKGASPRGTPITAPPIDGI